MVFTSKLLSLFRNFCKLCFYFIINLFYADAIVELAAEAEEEHSDGEAEDDDKFFDAEGKCLFILSIFDVLR